MRLLQGEDRYLRWVLTSATDYLNSVATGSTYAAISADDLGNVLIPTTRRTDQHAIANILDRETAQIDELIGKQNALIELLGERRGATIDRTLREIDGQLVPLRYVADMVTVGIVVTPSKWYADEGIIALRGTNVKPDAIDLDDVVRLTKEGHLLHSKSILRAGDVVIVRTGQAGAAAVVPPELDGINAIDLLIVHPGQRLLGEFLVMYMNSPACQERTTASQVGSIQGHFNVGSLNAMQIPLIPVARQQQIVSQWKVASAEIDLLISRARRFIELAKERRAALITAAVTGKIDVRGAA